jgi:hypothetical protein
MRARVILSMESGYLLIVYQKLAKIENSFS